MVLGGYCIVTIYVCRLFVLFEVESLFQSVTGGDSNRKGVLLPIYSKASRSLDAMNHGTVAEFIHHLMPNMYTSYRLMNADRTLIQTAIQSNRATRGFTSTVKNSKGKIVRRVTPETRLSIGVNEYERLSRGKQSSVQQSKVIELTDQKLEPLAVPVIIERQEVDSENISVDSLSSSLASSKVSMLLPQRKTNSTGKGSKGKENPRPSRQSPLKVHKERSNSILSSISITMKSPKYTFTPIANRGTPTKSLQAYASTDLFDTVGQSADAKADVLTRLESSFWIQHPELHQVCRFLLSHMYQSCLSHSKDRTAVPVRELLNALDSLQLTVKQRSSTNMNRPECISLLSNNLDYESESLKALNRIYNLYCEDGEKFIRNFYKTFQLKILPLLMKQFHAHKRVIKLVLSSINQIIASHIQQLVDLLRSYSYRKLHEAVGVKDRLFKTVKQSDISSSTCSITNNLVLSQQNAADEFTDREATQMLLPIKQSLCLLDNYYSFIALTTCKSSANSVDTVSASQLGSCKLEMVVRTQSLSQNSCNAVAHVCQVITHVYTILCQVCCRNRLSCGRYSDFKNFAAFKQDFDLVVFLENCEQLLKVITLATTAEQRGHLVKEKVTIELVKFFTKAFPLLLYLDEALAADLSENFSEINSSNITSAVEEQQLVSPNRVGFAASDMLSRFVEDQLLKFPVALRIVQLLVRSKVAQFYDNCKQIKFFSSIYGTLIKASVKRLVLNLFERYKTSEGSKANSSGAATTGNRSYLTSIPVSGGLDSPSAAPSLARSLFSDDDDSLLRDSPCTPQQFSNRYDNANSSSINAKAAGHAIEDTVLSVISERSTDWHQDRYLRAFISNNFGESVVSTIDTIVRDADTKLS